MRPKAGASLTALVAAALVSVGPVAAGERAIKVGIVHAPSHSFVRGVERFRELLESRSGGRLRVEIYPSGQLGGEREMQEMVSLGTLEMAVTGVTAVYEPPLALLEAPFLYRDRDHGRKVMRSPLVADLGERLRKKGLRSVGFFESGFRHITSTRRAIRDPGDVRGLTLRTPENLAEVETVTALGAVATPMAFNQLYDALARGVVDGQENPLQTIWHAKLYEVQKHLAVTGHIYSAVFLVVGEEFWGALPVDLRRLAEEAIREAERFQLNAVADLDALLLERLEAKGMRVTLPDKAAFRRATAAAYDALYGRFGERGRAIIEAIRKM